MNEYLQIEFRDVSVQQGELLMAALNEVGFEGFEETENTLKAFIKKSDFNEGVFQQSISALHQNFTISVIPETNWNQIWESNFEPVVVNDMVAVRAEFHQPIRNVLFEIIITPKMSFGTGHHATTYMMLENMSGFDFKNKNVLDFGTGTGVLAILAEKLGARKVVAIDIDRWSIENAAENLSKNQCKEIELHLSGTADRNSLFDVILANINRNIILENMSSLASQLSKDGFLLISGLLIEDEDAIIAECNKYQLTVKNKATRDKWLLLNISHSLDIISMLN